MTLSKQTKNKTGKVHSDTLLLKYRYAGKVSVLTYIFAPYWKQEQTRVADPDMIRIQSGQWIRIQEGKNDPQK
jgi:hypothetical protein